MGGGLKVEFGDTLSLKWVLDIQKEMSDKQLDIPESKEEIEMGGSNFAKPVYINAVRTSVFEWIYLGEECRYSWEETLCLNSISPPTFRYPEKGGSGKENWKEATCW